MKHSSIWFALILILSASLPSAAKRTSGERRGQNHASKVERASEEDQSGGTPIATPINQAATEKGDGHGSGETYNYNGNFNYTPPPSPPEGRWAIAGEIASVVSAVLVAVFTALLWHVSRQQKELMKTAEETSEAALHIYRPFLLVTGVECTDVKVINGVLFQKFAIHLKNFGVGPADIVSYIASADPLDTPIGNVLDIEEPTIAYVPENGKRLSDSLVGPQEELPNRIECTNWLDDELRRLIENRTKTLAVNGIITYRGTTPKNYETRFFWWFYMDTDGRPIRYVRGFRPDLNAHT